MDKQADSRLERVGSAVESVIDSATEALARPRLRGRLHQIALFVSLGGLAWIVSVAPTTRARVCAWIYAVAAVLLYFVSSTYHVFTKSPRARRIMQRVDHSMIFVLIAGTFTPIAVLVVRDPWRWPALVIIWTGAAIGIALKVFGFNRYRRLGGAMYIVLGWAGVIAFPSLTHRPGVLGLVIGGGVLYTVGAVLFSMHRPTLSPKWFGYHEVWHIFVVAAGVLFFIANFGLVHGG